jgi:hypothetical protein
MHHLFVSLLDLFNHPDFTKARYLPTFAPLRSGTRRNKRIACFLIPG